MTTKSMAIPTICLILLLSNPLIKVRRYIPIGIPIYLYTVPKPTSFQITYWRSLYVDVRDWKNIGIVVKDIASSSPNPLQISKGIAKILNAKPTMP